MRMVRPKLVAPQIQIAENQEEYLVVTAAVVRHPSYHAALFAPSPADDGTTELVKANSLVLAFKPNEEERRRLCDGEAIYVSLLTFMRPMQPIVVTVGEYDTAAMYKIEVER